MGSGRTCGGRPRRRAPAIAAMLYALLATSCGRGRWLTDLEAARQDAARRERSILLVVLADDGQSATLREALFQEEFLASPAGTSYTLLCADTAADSGWAELVQEQYYTEALPALFLLSEEGFVLDYVPFGTELADTEQLAAELARLAPHVAALRGMITAVHFSSGTEQVQAINTLYDATDERFRAPLADLCRQVLTLDSANHTGLAGKYELALAYADSAAALRSRDAQAASAIFRDAAEHGHLDKAQRFEAYVQAAHVLALTGSTDYDAMLGLLRQAYLVDPANAAMAQVNQLIRRTETLRGLLQADGFTASGPE